MSSAPLNALAVQFWKLCAGFERELGFLSPERVEAAEAQLRFARRRLETILDGEGLRLATYDGLAWTADIPASPANAEDMGEDATPRVAATLEPTIIGPDGVVHPGRILLGEG